MITQREPHVSMIRISLLSLVLILGGCSGPLSFLTPGVPDLEADVTVGKKEEVVETNVGNESVAADTINYVNELPWYYLVLLVFMAGWAIPSPMEMFRGMVNMIRLLFGRPPL